ncbi:MAG TPA: hypothetical protein VKV19_12900 [Ktedonobacteraceae bacterium]|nr:hypothetical protein [Ktedonobacteraceae bacterium]
MRNDSIETLLLRHYGSAAPVPVNLEQQLKMMVHREAARQQTVSNWNQRRISRRRVLQLVTFSGASVGAAVAVGINTLHNTLTAHTVRRPAYSL